MTKPKPTHTSGKEPPDKETVPLNAMLPGENGKFADYFLSNIKNAVKGTPIDKTPSEPALTQDKTQCAAGSLCKCGTMPLATRHRCMVCAFCLHTECGVELKETSKVKAPSTSVNQVCLACTTRFKLNKLVVKGELSLGLYSLHRFKRPKYPNVLLVEAEDVAQAKKQANSHIDDSTGTASEKTTKQDKSNESSKTTPMEIDEPGKKGKELSETTRMDVEGENNTTDDGKNNKNSDKVSDDETVNGDNRSENPTNGKTTRKTNNKTTTPPTYMDLHLMIPPVDSKASPAEIIECLRERLSSWLQGVQSLEQSFKLHTVDPNNQVQSVVHSPSEFPKSLSEIKDYFKGARPLPKGGKVFMKIKASFQGTAKTILSGTDWYHKNNNEVFRVSDLQSCHNDTVGWFLYSLHSMDIKLLETILERKMDHPIALRWRRINDGSPWISGRDTRNDPRAIHVECATIHSPEVEQVLKELYKTKAEKFPLHI